MRSDKRKIKSNKTIYRLVNGITIYRLFAAPILLILALAGQLWLFKWMVLISFMTDAIDGPLARRYHVESASGARIDSAADDLTVLVSFIALWLIRPEFVKGEWMILSFVFVLFVIQTLSALIVYQKFTSFHTYLAKLAAVMQALFFIMIFFEIGPAQVIFIVAALITAAQIIEEIILVILLPKWKANVGGIYWFIKEKFRIDSLRYN